MNEAMRAAVEESRVNLLAGAGGPFGAVIVGPDGRIVARAHNRVLETHDPTAHAEINAIREASRALGRFDLSDCALYTSCEPCPMCLSAILWAKITRVYFGCTRDDAAAIGFDDRAIYDYLAGRPSTVSVELTPCGTEEARAVFTEWSSETRPRY